MAEIKNSGFVLKTAYRNVQMKSIVKFPITNENLTDDLALKLVGYHPKGYGLFKYFPDTEKFDITKEVNGLTVILNNQEFKLEMVKKAFEVKTGKAMLEPTPYKYQVYFKKLSRKKRDAIINFLIGA